MIGMSGNLVDIYYKYFVLLLAAFVSYKMVHWPFIGGLLHLVQ